MFLWMTFSLLWGVCEGLWFFIVPDIILSFACLKGWKTAVGSTLAIIVGSIFAAIFLYLSMTMFPSWVDRWPALWASVPGYYPRMLEVASKHLQEGGAFGLLSGPSSGIPYRFYVFESFRQDISLWSLLVWTPLARLQRLFLTPLVILPINLILKKIETRYKWQPVWRQRGWIIVLLIYWTCTYIFYWGVFLPQHYQ